MSAGRSIHAVPSITPSPREGIEDGPTGAPALRLGEPKNGVAVVLAGVRIALKSRLAEDEALGRPVDRRATEAPPRVASRRWRRKPAAVTAMRGHADGGGLLRRLPLPRHSLRLSDLHGCHFGGHVITVLGRWQGASRAYEIAYSGGINTPLRRTPPRTRLVVAVL